VVGAGGEFHCQKARTQGGKCRNTDRRPNKNVNSPFLSLLKERCVFFFLRGLAPETCIFLQVARKKVQPGRPGEKAAQCSRYTKSPGKKLALFQPYVISMGKSRTPCLRPLYAIKLSQSSACSLENTRRARKLTR